MMCVLGGYRAYECETVQALAVALSEKVTTNHEWDEWCELYDRYC